MTDTATDASSPSADQVPTEPDLTAAPADSDRMSSDLMDSAPSGPGASEPATSAPAPSSSQTPRRGGSIFVGFVVGAAVAAGAGYGVQRYLVPQSVFDPSSLEARLTASEAELEGMRAEFARLSETNSAPATPDKALLDRIAALEARPAAPELAPLAARLDSVEANLAALANLPSETGVSPAALATLQAEVATLKSQESGVPAEIAATAAAVEARLTEAEARAADLTAQATAIASAAMRGAALGQISAALESGLPYRSALTTLTEAEVPEALAVHADTGLPTLASLREAFPDAARLALEQALRANSGESWADRVATFLRNQTGARSLSPREGNDPDAILSRAEAALAKADLPTALTEISALPPEAQTALAAWTALAQQRLDAQTALASLLQTAGQ